MIHLSQREFDELCMDGVMEGLAEEEKNKIIPDDEDADIVQLELKKRVLEIMGSQIFMKELELVLEAQWKNTFNEIKTKLYLLLEKRHEKNGMNHFLTTQNINQESAVLKTDIPDPEKITKWVPEGSPTYSSSPNKIDDSLHYVPTYVNLTELQKRQSQNATVSVTKEQVTSKGFKCNPIVCKTLFPENASIEVDQDLGQDEKEIDDKDRDIVYSSAKISQNYSTNDRCYNPVMEKKKKEAVKIKITPGLVSRRIEQFSCAPNEYLSNSKFHSKDVKVEKGIVSSLSKRFSPNSSNFGGKYSKINFETKFNKAPMKSDINGNINDTFNAKYNNREKFHLRDREFTSQKIEKITYTKEDIKKKFADVVSPKSYRSLGYSSFPLETISPKDDKNFSPDLSIISEDEEESFSEEIVAKNFEKLISPRPKRKSTKKIQKIFKPDLQFISEDTEGEDQL